MAVTFDGVDKFNSNQNYSKIKFGAGAPVLEVELMELQKIQNHKRNLSFNAVVVDGFVNKSTISYSSGNLIVPADTIVALGEFIEIVGNMTLSGCSSSDAVYLRVFEAEKNAGSTIYRTGNLSNAVTITNDILDTRVGFEVSRRIQKQVQLVKGPLPSPIPVGEAYLPVATIGIGNNFTDNRVKVVTFKSNTDYVRSPGYAQTTNSGNAYSVSTTPPLGALIDGVSIYLDINYTNTGNATLNWNSTGAIPIVDSRGTALNAGKLRANTIIGVRYDASQNRYQLQGEGSSSILHKNYQKLVGAGDVGTTLITIPGTYAPNTNTLSFYLNGIKQDVGNAYNEINPTTILCTSGLVLNDFIDITWVESENYVVATHNTSHNPGGGDDISLTYLTRDDYAISLLYNVRW